MQHALRPFSYTLLLLLVLLLLLLLLLLLHAWERLALVTILLSSSSRGCCSVPVLKLGLAVYNILLLACGGCVVGVTLWSLFTKYDQGPLLTSHSYPAVVGMLLTAGIISLLAGVLGCIALAREDRCSLVLYIFLLIVVLVLEGVAGVVAYVYQEQLSHLMADSLPSIIAEQYSVDHSVTTAVDSMQVQFRCCGGVSYTDWQHSTWKTTAADHRQVPDSCCKTVTPHCGTRDHPSNIWYTGCVHGLAQWLGEHVQVLGALGCCCCLLQLLGLTLACCLYVVLSRAY
ncbi:Tetraspanin/Peripherin [Trinorchestia longiramus]|nr:Tetraspanin/Peripherin [Trinorchestia longiramus]